MVREVDNEALAAVLRAIIIVESLTPYEREFLEEAAQRLQKEESNDNQSGDEE